MQGLLVFAEDAFLYAGSFRQRDVTSRKCVVHLKRLGDFPSNEPVSRSRHSPIEFRKQKNIGIDENRVLPKRLEDRIQLDSPLDIPCHRADRVTGSRRIGGKTVAPETTDHAIEFRLQFTVESGPFQFASRLETSQPIQGRPEALIEGQRYGHRSQYNNLQRNPSGPETLDNSLAPAAMGAIEVLPL